MGQPRLPKSLRRFVEGQTTRTVADIRKGEPKEHRSPYGGYWYRAVACILLSGRVQAKHDGTPNMTDVNRIGKEANFNQYLTERVGTFLVAADVLRFDLQNRYGAGPNLATFWAHDDAKLPAIARRAVRRLVGSQTGHPFDYARAPEDWGLTELLSLFFSCFRGLALVESEVGRVLHDFIRLPQDDLVQAAHGLRLRVDSVDVAGWQKKLDARGRNALVSALYTAEWAYYAEQEKTGWWFPSPTGLSMLGLGPPLPAPELATVMKAQPDLSVFAGAGLNWETLVPLFRHAIIRRVDQVYEFRLDRKRLAASPAGSAPGEELREALRDLEPLPSPVADLLGTKSKVGGTVGIRRCSALVKPESAEVLAAIREHPQLKGYLEPGAPPGYLLIKSHSRPDNFVRRCQDLGFAVTTL
ncbi:hypothetical protein OJF2_40320 [Aquisphaera giovannonii]|uniref:Helicase XPB/Ssl2 N-terminal domain-containing protein n=1 Tax=Aquisphaera giovannonii TaxID=406548 RepID=A0A5B9W680_9BACT|nr:hypothetical protein [Aquisphaera giovannonii]QEH35480.1 hypothetical protein OJF2_40320 [Aquisphaera giovannonii]